MNTVLLAVDGAASLGAALAPLRAIGATEPTGGGPEATGYLVAHLHAPALGAGPPRVGVAELELRRRAAPGGVIRRAVAVAGPGAAPLDLAVDRLGPTPLAGDLRLRAVLTSAPEGPASIRLVRAVAAWPPADRSASDAAAEVIAALQALEGAEALRLDWTLGPAPAAGLHLITREGPGAPAADALRLDPARLALIGPDGLPALDRPMLAWSFERRETRPDWAEIPALKAALVELRAVEAAGGPRERVVDALDRFAAAARACAELTPAHAEAMAAAAREAAAQAGDALVLESRSEMGSASRFLAMTVGTALGVIAAADFAGGPPGPFDGGAGPAAVSADASPPPADPAPSAKGAVAPEPAAAPTAAAPAPSARFKAARKLIGEFEGGYVDHPDDPGGATNFGITQNTLNGYRAARGLAPKDVADITYDEAGQIVFDDYWIPIRGDALPEGVDLVMFDFAVHSGPRRAVEFLQRILGVPIDGVLGPITLGALNQRVTDDADRVALIRRLLADREAFLRRRIATKPSQRVFRAGWANRLMDLHRKALGEEPSRITLEARPDGAGDDAEPSLATLAMEQAADGVGPPAPPPAPPAASDDADDAFLRDVAAHGDDAAALLPLAAHLKKIRAFDRLYWVAGRAAAALERELASAGGAKTASGHATRQALAQALQLEAQALTELGARPAARQLAERIAATFADDWFARREALCLIGRTWKDALAAALESAPPKPAASPAASPAAPPPAAAVAALHKAIQSYHRAWTTRIDGEIVKDDFPGVNILALLKRARDLRIDPPRGLALEPFAAEVRAALDAPAPAIAEKQGPWLRQSRLEVAVALEDWDAAWALLREIVEDPQAAPFALGSLHRQLTQLWGCDAHPNPRAQDLARELKLAAARIAGGHAVFAPREVDALQDARASGVSAPLVLHASAGRYLERYAFIDRFLDAGRAIARIEKPNGDWVGTGFLVAPETLSEKLAAGWGAPAVFLTNHHVFRGLRARDARLRFTRCRQGRTEGVEIADTLWWSRTDHHDCVVLRLRDLPDDHHALSIAAEAPPSPADGAAPQVTVIGHPQGQALAFATSTLDLTAHDGPSVAGEPRGLRYLAASEHGHSGSPVFDWRGLRLIGIHRGAQYGAVLDASVAAELERRGPPGLLSADGRRADVNAGVSLQSIRAALSHRPAGWSA